MELVKKRSILTLCFMILFGFLYCCEASSFSTFYVGGKEGWISKPAQSYNIWASKIRFRPRDHIVFRYNNRSDSVLLVNKEHYDNCETNNPIKKWDDGQTDIKFGRSGPFYFIGGSKDACQNGQKLTILVFQPRHLITPPPHSSPAPGVHPPQSSPSPVAHPPHTTPSSAPVHQPTQPPATSHPSPSKSPTQPHVTSHPAPSQSPTQPPAKSHPAPSQSPTQPPATSHPSPSPTQSPAQPPATSPSSPPPAVKPPVGSPLQSPSPQQSPPSRSPTASPRAQSPAPASSSPPSSGNPPSASPSPVTATPPTSTTPPPTGSGSTPGGQTNKSPAPAPVPNKKSAGRSLASSLSSLIMVLSITFVSLL